MGLVLITPPAVEPVCLADVKAFLRIEDDTEDQIITDLITAAREYLENRTGRAFITQTWQLTDDGFPSLFWKTNRTMAFRTVPQILGTPLPAIPFNPMALTVAQEIALPYPPLQAVTQVQYVDTNGNTQTLASNQYQVDNTALVGRIAPAYSLVWPVTLIGQYNAATITYTAGYGAAGSNVPLALRRAIRALVGVMYATRELTAPSGAALTPVPVAGVESIVQQYRAEWVF